MKINQYKEGNFYFDKGSPWLIIDPSFYKNQQMSFNRFSDSENKGVANNPVKMIRILDTMKISANSTTFYSKYNLVYNLKSTLGKNIDGVVGSLNFEKVPLNAKNIFSIIAA